MRKQARAKKILGEAVSRHLRFADISTVVKCAKPLVGYHKLYAWLKLRQSTATCEGTVGKAANLARVGLGCKNCCA